MATRRTPVPVTSAPPPSAEATLVTPDVLPPVDPEPAKATTAKTKAKASARTTRSTVKTTTRNGAAETAPAAKPARRNRTVFLNDDVWNRARSAAAYLGLYGDPDDKDVPSNLAELVEYALNMAVDELAARLNGGEPFPVARQVPRGPGRAGRSRISAAKTSAAVTDDE